MGNLFEEYKVVLINKGNNPVMTIKIVRDLTGLGLTEAKDLVDSAPSTIIENATKDTAEQVKRKFESVGALVELRTNTATHSQDIFSFQSEGRSFASESSMESNSKHMRAIICEMCQSNDLVKKDGLYVCQHCGTKYTIEEARKLLGVVKIDKSEDTKKLLILARRAHNEGNSENAEKYYGMILQEEPNNWEATFFQVYHRAMQTKLGYICSAAQSVSNCLESVAELLYKADKEEQKRAINTIINPCLEISNLFASASVRHYNEYMSVDGTFEECVNNLVATNLIYGKLEIIIKHFSPDKNTLVSFQKRYVEFLNYYKKFFNKEYLSSYVTRLSSEISKYDSAYQAPATNSGGCYVATAVYGSYDCPEVWTLRRFRDNTLAETNLGRLFVKMYYAISPTLVRWFGNSEWFKNMWKPLLDNIVNQLNAKGVENTVYCDKEW